MPRVNPQALNRSYGNERRKRCVFGKQAEMMWTWRGAAGRSRCGQRRQEKLGRRQSTAVKVAPALMWSEPIVGGFSTRDLRAGGVRRPDTSVPFRAYICMWERPAWTESTPELSISSDNSKLWMYAIHGWLSFDLRLHDEFRIESECVLQGSLS